MKKVFLTVVLFAGFGLAASAQSLNDGCGPDATPISSTCWSGCVSVMTMYGPRKPTASEYIQAQGQLQDWCNNKPIVQLSPA